MDRDEDARRRALTDELTTGDCSVQGYGRAKIMRELHPDRTPGDIVARANSLDNQGVGEWKEPQFNLARGLLEFGARPEEIAGAFKGLGYDASSAYLGLSTSEAIKQWRSREQYEKCNTTVEIAFALGSGGYSFKHIARAVCHYNQQKDRGSFRNLTGKLVEELDMFPAEDKEAVIAGLDRGDKMSGASE